MNKWFRSNTGTYMYGDYRICKTPSGRITKRSGWDVYKAGYLSNKKHFNKLIDAQAYVENL